MLALAKIALGLSATLVMSTAYVFHEGVIKVDVDELEPGGSHLHFWVPATAVSAGLYVVPQHHLARAAEKARPYLPVIRQLARELEKYPDADFVEVRNATDHVRISTVGGRIQIDATSPTKNVHVRVPLQTLEDVSDHLEGAAPTI